MYKIIYTLICLIIFISSSIAEETFVSLKKNKVNVRYGPSFDSDIKYVYKKINLPLKLIDKKENFRRIIDLKNNSGWIHISQLKRNNSVITLQNKILFKKPSSFAKPIAQIEKFKSNGVEVEIGIDHKEYSHTTKLSSANISSLAADFS